MSNPKLLYSTSSLLSYRVCKKYYNDKHYVWVAIKAGSERLHDPLLDNPPTSRPLYRYKVLKEESQKGDLHGFLINEQKAGIRKGAEIKYDNRLISENRRDEILKIVELSNPSDYKPLLYIMPYENVEHLLKEVSVEDRAHPISEEYIIEELPGDAFDIIDLDEF